LVKTLLRFVIIGFRESLMKFVSSNFFNMEKQPKKSDVGVVKVSMLFAGENKVINRGLNVKIAVYYLQIIDLNND